MVSTSNLSGVSRLSRRKSNLYLSTNPKIGNHPGHPSHSGHFSLYEVIPPSPPYFNIPSFFRNSARIILIAVVTGTRLASEYFTSAFQSGSLILKFRSLSFFSSSTWGLVFITPPTATRRVRRSRVHTCQGSSWSMSAPSIRRLPRSCWSCGSLPLQMSASTNGR